MLDVHPPHEPTHTWKDFLLHIATIVVGLLIAVGLEQTVEYLHHRHQLAETREALIKELETNKGSVEEVTTEFRRYVPILRTNLTILRFLQTHPGAPMAQWPGEYRLSTFVSGFNDDHWQTARQNNTVSLMPSEEATRYADIYKRYTEVNAFENDRTMAIDELKAIMMEDPDPSHLQAAQLDLAVNAVRKCLLVESRIARGLGNLAYSHPELHLKTPSPEERLSILPVLKTPQYESDRAVVNAILAKRFGERPSQEAATAEQK